MIKQRSRSPLKRKSLIKEELFDTNIKSMSTMIF